MVLAKLETGSVCVTLPPASLSLTEVPVTLRSTLHNLEQITLPQSLNLEGKESWFNSKAQWLRCLEIIGGECYKFLNSFSLH